MESQRLIDARFARDLAWDSCELIFTETEKKRQDALAAYRVANDEYLWVQEEKNNDTLAAYRVANDEYRRAQEEEAKQAAEEQA